jgi:hypothetical protein
MPIVRKDRSSINDGDKPEIYTGSMEVHGFSEGSVRDCQEISLNLRRREGTGAPVGEINCSFLRQ